MITAIVLGTKIWRFILVSADNACSVNQSESALGQFNPPRSYRSSSLYKSALSMAIISVPPPLKPRGRAVQNVVCVCYIIYNIYMVLYTVLIRYSACVCPFIHVHFV